MAEHRWQPGARRGVDRQRVCDDASRLRIEHGAVHIGDAIPPLVPVDVAWLSVADQQEQLLSGAALPELGARVPDGGPDAGEPSRLEAHQSRGAVGPVVGEAFCDEDRQSRRDWTQWKDEAGLRLTLGAWKGRWYALTFVYTSCAGSCPLTTRKLKRLDEALQKAGKPLELVVVSLDPTHDTPEVVKQYRARYELEQASRWRILVGDDDQVRTLTMLLEFKYTKNPQSGVILHDNTVYLVGPDGTVKTSMSSLDQALDPFVAEVPAPRPR